MTVLPRRVAIIDAHPDPNTDRYVHALAEAYCRGAHEGGHEVRLIALGDINIPLLHSRTSWLHEPLPVDLEEAQAAILWAQHIVFLYPLWFGDMPAQFKAFLEQVLRPGFAFDKWNERGARPLLGDRTAHIVVTMGMPAFFYRMVYGAHSVRSFKRNILAFVGIETRTVSLIGNVEGSAKHREKWLERMAMYGRAAD